MQPKLQFQRVTFDDGMLFPIVSTELYIKVIKCSENIRLSIVRICFNGNNYY
jgi:hypothetical protein